MNTLQDNWEKLEQVVELLLKKETITGDEVRRIIAGEKAEDILKGTEIKEESIQKGSEGIVQTSENSIEESQENKTVEAEVHDSNLKSDTEKLAEAVREITGETGGVLEPTEKNDFDKDSDDNEKNDDDNENSDDSSKNDSDSDDENENSDNKSEKNKKRKSNFKLPSFME